jgi:hypothetical protein
MLDGRCMSGNGLELSLVGDRRVGGWWAELIGNELRAKSVDEIEVGSRLCGLM